MYLELARNSKVPRRKGPWKLFTEPPEGNIGKTLEGMSVVDFDDKEAGRAFFREHQDLCTFIVETRRGVHFHFNEETKGRKFKYGDIKSGPTQYVVYPPSIVDGWTYKFVRQGELLDFPESLFPIAETRTEVAAVMEDDPVHRVIRARAWMLKRETKEQGSGRGLQTIKTFRAFFAKFGLTEEQVWPLALEYNERFCVPLYTEQKLRHKISDAQKGLR